MPKLQYLLQQGSPAPGPRTCTGRRPVRNQAAQQKVSGGRVKLHLCLQRAPHCSHYRLSSTSCQHYGELYNYFIIYYNVIIIERMWTINLMRLNHPETISLPAHPWKNCLPRNQSLVPERFGTAVLQLNFYMIDLFQAVFPNWGQSICTSPQQFCLNSAFSNYVIVLNSGICCIMHLMVDSALLKFSACERDWNKTGS